MRDSHVVIKPGRHPRRSGAQTFDAVQWKGAETVAKAAAAVGAEMVHNLGIAPTRPRRRITPRARRPGEKGGGWRRSLGHHHAASWCSAGGSVHQPLRGAGEDRSCRYADRGGSTKLQPSMSATSPPAIADPWTARPSRARPMSLAARSPDMREIIEIILDITDRRRMLVTLRSGSPNSGPVLAICPRRAETDAGSGRAAADRQCGVGRGKTAGLTLEGLGITPDSLERSATQYLWRFRPAGHFRRARNPLRAGKPPTRSMAMTAYRPIAVRSGRGCRRSRAPRDSVKRGG